MQESVWNYDTKIPDKRSWTEISAGMSVLSAGDWREF